MALLKPHLSLAGRQASLCIWISSLLLCTELGEMPRIQSSRRMPPPRRLLGSHKQPFNQKEKKRVENEICAQPWMIQNTAISVDSDHRLLSEYSPLGTMPFPLSFCYLLPSNSSALELVLWSFGSHLAQYDWSSYHLTPLYTPNIYRPIDTPWGGIHTT